MSPWEMARLTRGCVRRGCCRNSGATAVPVILIGWADGSNVFFWSSSHVKEPASQIAFKDVVEDEGAELPDDKASKENTEEDDEDAEEATEEVYG